VRRFHLNRVEDETGISGTGVITDGIEFDDGTVIMKWNTFTTSVGIYRCIDDVIKIHGHEGKTKILWADSETFDVYPNFLEGSKAVRYISPS
jgi:hypothetical protein